MQNKHIIYWLRFVTFFLFFGRAWQHFQWNGPYGNLFYSEHYFGKLIGWFTNSDAFTYLSNPKLAFWYDLFNDVLGVVFILSAISVLFVNKKNNWYKKMVKAGGFMLVFVAYGYYVECNFVTAQFLEYSAQMITPFLLLLAVKFKMNSNFLFLSKLAIGVTFVCHGLYALGYYPLPGNFMNMTLNGLPLSNEQSVVFLAIVGYLDLIFAVGIFIPFVSKYFLYYGLIWGFLTAFARVFTTFDGSFVMASLSQNTFEFLVRMPHFIIPLLLLRYKKEIVI